MKNETEFKRAFKQSVKHFKGCAISLAAPMVGGIPDLYVVMPGFMPVLLEAKWLGEIKYRQFQRNLTNRFTARQLMYLKECNDVVPYSAMVLIGLKFEGVIQAALVKYGSFILSGFNQNSLLECAYVVYERSPLVPKNKYFDVYTLFNSTNVPRISP